MLVTIASKRDLSAAVGQGAAGPHKCIFYYIVSWQAGRHGQNHQTIEGNVQSGPVQPSDAACNVVAFSTVTRGRHRKRGLLSWGGVGHWDWLPQQGDEGFVGTN